MNDQDSLVSVVIPTYNRPKYLERAIRSVNAQDYENIELIVVDDHSETPIGDVVRSVSNASLSGVEIIRHDRNRGQATARNTGIEAASGEFLAFLDDDDQWLPSKLTEQTAAMQRAGSGVGIVFVETDQESFEDKVTRFSDRQQAVSTKRLLCKNVVGTPSRVLVRSECIDTTGGFDERFRNWEDQDWYIRLSQDWDFTRLRRPLIKYSSDSDNRITEDFATITEDVYPLFIEKYTPLAEQYGPLFKRKMRAWAAYRAGKVGLYTQNYQKGMKFLQKAILTYPLQGRFYLFPLIKLTFRKLFS